MTSHVEPRYNEVARDWENELVITGVGNIGVLFLFFIVYCTITGLKNIVRYTGGSFPYILLFNSTQALIHCPNMVIKLSMYVGLHDVYPVTNVNLAF